MAVVHADFLKDLGEHHRTEMLAAGIHVPPGADHLKCTELYFNVRFRRIPSRPRRLHESDVLACPKGMEDAFSFLKLKMLGGEDLNPHLSRKLSKAAHNDRATAS